MGVSNVPAASAAGLQPKYQKFTSSGTFTLPTGYGAAKPLLVNIQVIGGGGGGSNARFNDAHGFQSRNTAYNANYGAYFGNGRSLVINTITGANAKGAINSLNNITNGKAGGSGGIVQSQLYLTSNLTITVGAAGTRPNVSSSNSIHDILISTGGQNVGEGTTGLANITNTSGNYWTNQDQYTVGLGAVYAVNAGGTGGTTTAGSLSATGGTGASGGNQLYISATGTFNFNQGTNQNTSFDFSGASTLNQLNASTVGAGGQPAGNAGAASPLLGTIAGGSNTATPVYGSFGVGGIKTDAGTSTGVEGTGGGFDSVGASGAVILTWWE